jgi:hypothetical protein
MGKASSSCARSGSHAFLLRAQQLLIRLIDVYRETLQSDTLLTILLVRAQRVLRGRWHFCNCLSFVDDQEDLAGPHVYQFIPPKLAIVSS